MLGTEPTMRTGLRAPAAKGPRAGQGSRGASTPPTSIATRAFPREAFDALRQARLLSAYVPEEYGGMGLNIVQVGRICEALGQYCGSSAMIYAMHMIQVGLRRASRPAVAPTSATTCAELVEEQRLMASATTEVGVGGDLRTSLCAVEVDGDSLPPDQEGAGDLLRRGGRRHPGDLPQVAETRRPATRCRCWCGAATTRPSRCPAGTRSASAARAAPASR